MKAAVLGCGAIGGAVARELRGGGVPGAELSGVVHGAGQDPPDLPVSTVDEVLERSDLVVECAGQRALAEAGPRVIASGADLLAVSVGALADAALLTTLRDTGPGRLRLCSGAVGGLELLASAARAGGLRAVRIVTTKKAATLAQSLMAQSLMAQSLMAQSMDDQLARRVRDTTEPLELMRGPAGEVARAFPSSANVAASVALAAGGWDFVEAVVVADPDASSTSHVIDAEGSSGQYRFEIRNQPSARNPATSRVVAQAVLESLARIASPTGAFA